MAIYLLKNLTAKTVKGTNALIVAAESAALAKTFAASHYNGDSTWSEATAVTLAGGTMDDNASMLGWTFSIEISDGAAQTVDPITVSTVGTGTDDLDAIAADLVTALNATADIANAAYAAPDLTVAAIADGIGDATVLFKVTAPSGDTTVDLSSLFYTSITDGGIAAAALVIALKADTVTTPEVLAEVKV